MNILALDLGTKCGWASNYLKPSSGVWDLKNKLTESIGMRYIRFGGYLSNCGLADIVVYEEVHNHRAVDAAHVFGGLQAILQTFCLESKIEYRGIGVGTIKKWATGNGNAKKDAMICAAALKFKGVNVIDDNHADALWLLDYATKSFNLTSQ